MLVWYESDGTTPLGSVDLGVIGPGESYTGKNAGVAKQIVLKNNGSGAVSDVQVDIMAVGSFAAAEYTLIATGVSQPGSGSFVDHNTPLAIGTLAPTATASVWIDMVVPNAANRQLGQMVTFRASGAE